MFRIAKNQKLNDSVTLMEVEAPEVAKKAKAGQFIIFRVDEFGERVPLTIADTDPERGTVTIIFQIVGRSTMLLNGLKEGDYLLDFVGPLGIPSHLNGYKKVAVVGGGVGCAIAYPAAKALHNMGVKVDIVAGFRSKDIVILESEMRKVCDNYYLMTDDGTAGEKGFTTTKLKELLEKNGDYDLVIAIGDNRGRELHRPLLTRDVRTIGLSHQPVPVGVQPAVQPVAGDCPDHPGCDVRRHEALRHHG
jgi:ferredoxin--NADP+ reductase